MQDKNTDLLMIPGVGKHLKKRLLALGIACVEDLKGKDPQQLYDLDCTLSGEMVDRCVLYVYRSVVYFAQEPSPELQKLKWWNWKD